MKRQRTKSEFEQRLHAFDLEFRVIALEFAIRRRACLDRHYDEPIFDRGLLDPQADLWTEWSIKTWEQKPEWVRAFLEEHGGVRDA